MGQASITIDINAQVHGLQETVEKYKQALEKIDVGTSYGKQLQRALKGAEKDVERLAAKPQRRVTSELGITRVFDEVENVVSKLNDVRDLFQGVQPPDLKLEGLSKEAQNIDSEIKKLTNDLQAIENTGFSKLIEQSGTLSKTFKDLGVDLNKLTPEGGAQILSSMLDPAIQKAKDLRKEWVDLKEEQKKLQEKTSIEAAENQQIKGAYNKTTGSITALKKMRDSGQLENTKEFDQTKLDAQIDEWMRAAGVLDKVKGKLPEVSQAFNQFKQNLSADMTGKEITLQFENLRENLKTIVGTASSADAILGSKSGVVKQIQGAIVETPSQKAARAQQIIEGLNQRVFSNISDDNALKQSFNDILNITDVSQRVNAVIDFFNQLKQAILDVEEANKKMNAELASDTAGKKQEYQAAMTQAQDIRGQQTEYSGLVQQYEGRIQQLEKDIADLRSQLEAYQKQGAQQVKNDSSLIGGRSQEILNESSRAANKYTEQLHNVEKAEKMVGKIEGITQRWFSIYAAVRMVGNAVRSVISTIKELDKTITEIAIVTNMSQDELWGQMKSYTDMARQYASSISGVYKVSQLYYQQGLQTADVMALTEQTLKMARISGLDYADATNYMTNAVRSFKMEMDDAQRVVDVYSAVAASSATDTTELATAMSKTASSAAAVGSSFENTTAMMAVMIEATRESAENIGSAMKSIISRYGEMTSDPSKIVDSEGEEMSLNRVDKALQTVGISIHDAAGQFRDFDDVITELAGKWDTIDTNTQRYIATIMAGNRQQSRFLALVSNGERLAELSEEAANSEDASTLQYLKTLDSIDAKTQQLKTSLQSLYVDTGIENFFKTMIDYGNNVVKTLTSMNRLFKLPIPAITSIGVTFWNVSRVVTAAFEFIKVKLESLSASIRTKETMEAQRGASERIEILRIEDAEMKKLWDEQEHAYLLHTKNLTDISRKGSNETLNNAQQASQSGVASGTGGIFGGRLSAGLSRGLSLGASALSIGASALSAGVQNKQMKGALGALSSGLSGFSMGMMTGNPVIAALGGGFGLVTGFLKNMSLIMPTLEQQIETLKEEATEKNNEAIQKRGETKDLASQIENLKKLEAARYDSAEAEDAYYEAANQMADTYPNLIKSLDEAGNATIDLNAAEQELANSRQKSIEAAQEAAAANYRVAEKEEENTENKAAQEGTDYIKHLSGRLNFEQDIEPSSRSYTGSFLGYQLFDKVFKDKDAFTTSDAANEFFSAVDNLYETILDPTELNKGIKNLIHEYSTAEKLDASKLGVEYYDLINSIMSPLYSELPDFNGVIHNKELKQLLTGIQQPDSDYYKENIANKSTDEILSGINIDELTEQERSIYSYLQTTWSEAMGAQAQKVLQKSNFSEQTITSGIAQVVGASITGLNKEYLTKIENSTEIINLAIREKMNGSELDPDEYLESTDILEDIEEAQQILANYYQQATSFDISRLNSLVKNKGAYSDKQYKDYLENTLKMTDELVALYMQDYQDEFYSTDDLINAANSRGRKDFTLLSDDFIQYYKRLNFFDDLGGEERKKILEVYDQIGSQIDASNISADIGKDALDKYIEVWKTTQLFGDKAEEAQGIINNWDDFSFAGLQELYQALIEQFGENNPLVETLYAAAADFANLMPKNFEAEVQTYSQKITSGMEDFEKAISNASKGMDFKTASELANKIGVDITDFDFKDGKYFADNYFGEIQEAFFGANSELEANLIKQKNDTITAFEQGSRTGRRSELLSDLQDIALQDEETLNNWINENLSWINNLGFGVNEIKQYGLAYIDYKKTTDSPKQFSEWLPDYLSNMVDTTVEESKRYITDQTARVAIASGDFENFAEIIDPFNFFGTKELIDEGQWNELAATYPQFARDILENYNKINKEAYDSIISGFDETKFIQANKINSQFLSKLQKSGFIEHVAGFGAEAVYQVAENIDLDKLANEISNDATLDTTAKNKYLSQIHSEKYAKNTYDILSGIVGSYDKFSYDIAQKYANAQDSTVKELISEGTFSVDAAGNISMSEQVLLEELAKARGEAITSGDQKLYNDLYAQYQKHKNEKADNQILSTIIQNRDKLSEENVASLATMFGQTYEWVANLLNKNSDGTYSASLNMLSDIIIDGKKEISQEIVDLFATEIDEIISSITGLAGSQSKGFTDLNSMQKYVSEMRKRGVTIDGEEASLKNMFEYNNSLHAYQLSEQGMVAHIQGMKYELDALQDSISGEEWFSKSPEEILEIQEQISYGNKFIDDTIRQFAENINISDYLDTQYGDPARAIKKEELVNAIEDYNAALFAIGEEEGLNANKIVRALNSGGQNAVAAMEAVAQAQGRTLNADEVASAYRASVDKYTNAIETIAARPGEIVDSITAQIIGYHGGVVKQLGETGQYVVESAANLYEAYTALLERMRITGEATLAELNQVAALALENKDTDQVVIDALGDAAGMTYTRFGEILTNAGYQLTEELVNSLEQSGIIRGLGGNKMQIVDFQAFADLMQWDADSEEYVSAFKAYNDSLIEMNRQVEKNIFEEVQSLKDAKIGDQINLTQLSDVLNKETKGFFDGDAIKLLTDELKNYGATLQNGILTLGADANLPAIIQTIASYAQEYGGLLESEMAELADVLDSVLQEYVDAIASGIDGKLSNVEAQNLQATTKSLGIDLDLDFTKTAEGLRLSRDSAQDLYFALKEIDGLKASLVFNNIFDDLVGDLGSGYNNMADTMATIKEIQTEIAKNEAEIAAARALSANNSRIQILQNENKELERQLQLSEQIAAKQMTSPESYDFMSGKLPDYMQGPENYWNSVGSAYKTMNEAASNNNMMDLTDYYNIVNEMANLAALSNNLELDGQKFNSSAEYAAYLIEAGCNALTNVDGEGVKVNLSNIGVDFLGGADSMQGNFEAGVKAMAQSQIDMLDAAIQLLETIVAMEKLGDIDVEGNGIEWDDLFETSGEMTTGFSQMVDDIVEQITPNSERYNEALATALGNIQLGGASLAEIFKLLKENNNADALEDLGISGEQFTAVMNAYLKALQDGSYDLETIQQSIWENFENSGLGNLGMTIDIGDTTISLVGDASFTIDWKSDKIEKLAEEKDITVEKLKETYKNALEKWNAKDNTISIDDLKIIAEVQGVVTEKVTVGENGDKKEEWEYNGQMYESEEAAVQQYAQDTLAASAGADMELGETAGTEGQYTVHMGRLGNITYVVDETGTSGKYEYNGQQFDTLDKVWQYRYLEACNDWVSRGGSAKDFSSFEEWKLTMDPPQFTFTKGTESDKTQALKAINEGIDEITATVNENQDGWTLDIGGIALEVSDITTLQDDKGNLDPEKIKEALLNDLGLQTMIAGISEGITQAFTQKGDVIAQSLFDGINAAIKGGEEGTSRTIPELTVSADDLKIDSIKESHYDETLKLSKDIENGEGNISNLTVNATNFTPSEQLASLQNMDFSTTSSSLQGVAGGVNTIAGASFSNFEGLKSLLSDIEGQVDTIWKTIQNFANQTFTVEMKTVTGSGEPNNYNPVGPTKTTPKSGQTPGQVDMTPFITAITVMQNALSTLDASPAETAASKFNTAMQKTMNSVPSSKTVTVKVNTPKDATLDVKAGVTVNVSVTGPGTSKGTTVITGDTSLKPKTIKSSITTTARAKGTAAAGGRRTLVGELGPELVVSNGHYYTVGNDGAEFVYLPADAIVFNHLQTRRLLNNKKINGRGDVATTEKRAVSWATGNTNGPAMASASAALAALKQIRAMWQSMLDASAKDLGSQAGRGGAGGGGGGGGGGDDKDPKTTTAEIERWYNLLRQIDKIQKDISYQEKLQEQYEKDRIANGQKIFESQKKQLQLLDQELVRHQEVAELQKSWYDHAREELSNSWYGQYIFTYTEDGLQQYISDAPGSGRGLDILEELTRRDKGTGEAIDNGATAEAQLRYLSSLGFNLNDLLYNEDGTKIADAISENLAISGPHDGRDAGESGKNDIYVEMMENFWNHLDGWKEELDSLYDSYREQLENVIENQNAQYEIIQAWVDNELDVEKELLNAIESREQQVIDTLEDQKDALDDATNKFLDGLNKTLQKERDMYSQNQSDTELVKLQRQLAILQRSGGSASQIRDLQDQIASKQQDSYFEAQQKQIDAIQEASDLEIERLDAQIDLLTKTLEYQKEHGLLWSEVREIMATNTPEEAAEKVRTWNKEYMEKSSLDIQESIRDFQEKFEEWTGFKDYKEEEAALTSDIYSKAGLATTPEVERAKRYLEQDNKQLEAEGEARTAAVGAYKRAVNNGNNPDEALEAAQKAYNENIIEAGKKTTGWAHEEGLQELLDTKSNAALTSWEKSLNEDEKVIYGQLLDLIKPAFINAYKQNAKFNEEETAITNEKELQKVAAAAGLEALDGKIGPNTPVGLPFTLKSNRSYFNDVNGKPGERIGSLSGVNKVRFIDAYSKNDNNRYLKFITGNGTVGWYYHDEFTDENGNTVSTNGNPDFYNKVVEFLEKRKNVLGYSSGGLNEYTGLAMLHGTKQHPESVLNAAQTKFLKEDLLSNKANSLVSIVSQLQDIFGDTASSSILTNNDEGIVIKDVTINISSDTIANDYDARRAGDQILDQMLRIAKKSGTRGISRR